MDKLNHIKVNTTAKETLIRYLYANKSTLLKIYYYYIYY